MLRFKRIVRCKLVSQRFFSKAPTMEWSMVRKYLDEMEPRDFVRELFDHIDKNHDGTLQPEELLEALKDRGLNLDAKKAQLLIGMAEEKQTSGIEFQDFKKVMESS